jgi:RND family efflux transporter MFP subunit
MPFRICRWNALLAAATLGLTVGCTRTPSTVANASQTETARPVAVERVTRQDLTRSIELAAEFRPYQQIDVHAKIAGYLKVIYVDVGDHVKKDQLIAELEAPEMTQDLAQAEATLKRSQLDIDRAKSEVQRSQAERSIRQVSFDRLSAVIKARPNLVAQQEVDDASAHLQEAEAQLSAAQAALASSQQQVEVAAAAKDRLDTMLTYLKITAPFDGIITKRMADTGAMIQAGTASNVQAMPVVQLSEVDHLRLILPVPESVVPRIKLNAPVEVRVDSLSRIFQGRISRFSDRLDPATRTMETEVDLPNPDNVIKPGMFGYATLSLDRHQDALSVPVQALSSRTSPASVLVVNGSHRLEARQVNLGLETPDRFEVLSGLSENDLVVVGERGNLKAGLLVDPKMQDVTAQTEQ